MPDTNDGIIAENIEEMEDNWKEHNLHISTHIDCDWDLWLQKKIKNLFNIS
jgi:hypothetical protein